MSQVPNNVIRQLLILGVILLLGIVLFTQLSSLIPAFLGAYTLYVLLRKWNFLLQDKYKWKKGLTASLLMLISFLIIMVPVFLLVNAISAKIGFAVKHSADVLSSIEKFVNQYEQRYQVHIITADNIQKLSNWAAGMLPKLLGTTISTITIIVVVYFILYFMLVQSRQMESNFYDWVPLKDENVIMLRKELNSLVISNAVGIPLIGLVQALILLASYFILGVSEPMFWFVITWLTAMLPLGAFLAYVPIALLFFANGHEWKGIIMLIYGFGITGTLEHLFRFWLQKKLGDVHPLITGFGVIIGVELFGFIGLIFGPILISIFLLLIRVYANEFNVRKRT
jgi:predicted PurR-regulated permease PerM